MKKTITIILIILLIAGGVGAALYFLVFKKAPVKEEDKVYVQSVAALQAYGGYSNRYNGVVEAQKSVKADFDPEKKLKELFVSVGDTVDEEDPLFSYDTESISLEIDQLKLEIDRLNTEIINDNDQIALLSKDMDKLSDTDRLDYSAQIAQLQAEIAQAEYDVKTKQSDIRQKEISIENSTILAKMAGTVTHIADVNDIISGLNLDESGNQTNAFITIQAEGNFRIRGKITETNISDIYQGEEMTVRSRVDATKTWVGTVSSIDTQNTSSDQSDYYGSSDSASKYNFYVELANTDGLMIGQHVILEPYTDADITSEGIWLDSGWIVTDEDGSQFVWAAASDGAKLEKRAIETGTYLEETAQFEIISGLAESDYLAWPEDSCYEGAPTTSEYIVPESDPESMSDGMTEYETYNAAEYETDGMTEYETYDAAEYKTDGAPKNNAGGASEEDEYNDET